MLATLAGAACLVATGVPSATLGADDREVAIGERAPDFALLNVEGKKTRLSDYKGKKNVVLVFARAHW
ncbi:MAG: hypothetical protein D6725_16350 [Planctomycetota bacterium]|nr:MAG: hypothetical protein D6725_16350 [Planctomycetota bacterium]